MPARASGLVAVVVVVACPAASEAQTDFQLVVVFFVFCFTVELGREGVHFFTTV